MADTFMVAFDPAPDITCWCASETTPRLPSIEVLLEWSSRSTLAVMFTITLGQSPPGEAETKGAEGGGGWEMLELACSILPRGTSAGIEGLTGSADGGLPGAACVAHTARSLRNSHSRVVAFGMQRLPACEGSLCAYASKQAVAFPLRAAHPSKGTSSKTLNMPTVTSMQDIGESIGESGRGGEGGRDGEGGSGGEIEGGSRGERGAGYGTDGVIPGQIRGCN